MNETAGDGGEFPDGTGAAYSRSQRYQLVSSHHILLIVKFPESMHDYPRVLRSALGGRTGATIRLFGPDKVSPAV